MRTQSPVSLPDFDEPQPDGAVVRGSKDDYRSRHPGPGDILCVIEVSDSSLPRDRGTKLRAYADANVPQYVIENLPDRLIEVHTDPIPGTGRYGTVQTFRTGSVTLNVGGGQVLSVPVADLLPSP